MATINLGAIKFNWKGAYSGATAYVVDDVVESSGSSYICIAATTGNAPPNATYWEQMSSAGTNGTDGTDLTTTLTTQGDIVYRDGSGLARLGAGTSGQVLQTNGTGANPSWVDASSGGLIKSFEYINTTRYSISNSSDNAIFSFTFNKQENATTSKVYVSGVIPTIAGQAYFSGIYFDCLTSGVTSHNTDDSFAFQGLVQSYAHDAGSPAVIVINKTFENSNLGSGNHTFEFGYRLKNGASEKAAAAINPNTTDDARNHQTGTIITLQEIMI